MSHLKSFSAAILAAAVIALPAIAEAQRPRGRAAPRGGPAVTGRAVARPAPGPYRPYAHRPAYGPYYRPYYRPYYGYGSSVSIGIGFGFGYGYGYGFYGPYAYAPFGYGAYGAWGYGPYGPYRPYAYAPYAYAPYGYGYGYGYPAYAVRPYGGVRVDLPQRDAEVYADGYFLGVVDQFDGNLQQANLETGPHRIEVRKPGFETIAFDVNIEPGRTITYRAAMRAQQP